MNTKYKTEYDFASDDDILGTFIGLSKSNFAIVDALIYFDIGGLYSFCNKNDCEGFYSPGNSVDICKLFDLIEPFDVAIIMLTAMFLPVKNQEQFMRNLYDKMNKGGAIINNVETNLFSPGDLSKAKMTILGDPDYLDQSLEGSFGSVKSKQTQGKSALSDFYGRNLTVSANGGQVFIEITFAEGRDYNENGNIPDGLKYINGKIKFWDYPEEIAKRSPNSIIYQVLSVATTFANGKFTQELELVIVNWPNDGKKETTQADSAGRPTENAQSQATPPTTGRPSTNAASLRANINAAAGETSQPPTVAPPKKTTQPFVEPSAPTLLFGGKSPISKGNCNTLFCW
jgi:hypothetical protein